MDLPREELLAHANATLARLPAGAKVYFKFTCENCGERVLFQEPNILYEEGECCRCGHLTKILAGGYLLECKHVKDTSKSRSS